MICGQSAEAFSHLAACTWFSMIVNFIIDATRDCLRCVSVHTRQQVLAGTKPLCLRTRPSKSGCSDTSRSTSTRHSNVVRNVVGPTQRPPALVRVRVVHDTDSIRRSPTRRVPGVQNRAGFGGGLRAAPRLSRLFTHARVSRARLAALSFARRSTSARRFASISGGSASSPSGGCLPKVSKRAV
jgi:hypothetical protein